MSPAGSADRPGPVRLGYGAELEQLRLQIEVMGLRVDQNLERMREVLTSGAPSVAAEALAADDEIDAMNVSLTERCYDVLARETPGGLGPASGGVGGAGDQRARAGGRPVPAGGEGLHRPRSPDP